MSPRPLAPVAAAAALALAGCGTGSSPEPVLGGHAATGKQLIEHIGCGACHQIGGIAGADGHVGPPLTSFAAKGSIAGVLPNDPAAVEKWIQHPQRYLPGSIMPELGVGPKSAADITAYLYGQ